MALVKEFLVVTKQEEMRENVARLITKKPLKSPTEKEYKRADMILFNLQNLGAVIRVKCPDCSWSQFAEDEAVAMTPCYSCNSTGYIIKSLV